MAFPRCYINYNQGKRNIEYYQDGDKDSSRIYDYETVLYMEDTKFFFVQEEPFDVQDTVGFRADIDLYFIIDFEDISLNTDQDYQVLSDVLDYVQMNSSFEVLNVETDYRDIFRNTVFIEECDQKRPFFSFKIKLRSERFTINQKLCTNEC